MAGGWQDNQLPSCSFPLGFLHLWFVAMLATAYIPAAAVAAAAAVVGAVQAKGPTKPFHPLSPWLSDSVPRRCFSSISRWVGGRPDRGGGQVRSVFVVGAIYLSSSSSGGGGRRLGWVTSSMTSQRWPTPSPNGGHTKPE